MGRVRWGGREGWEGGEGGTEWYGKGWKHDLCECTGENE